MKVKLDKIPIVSGIQNAINVLRTVELTDYTIFSKKKGIECIIYNGYVCDSEGTPFRNLEFQETFKWFSSRVKSSSAIVLGVVTLKKEINYRFTGESDIYSALSNNSTYSDEKVKNYVIEIYDIKYANSEIKIHYKTRRNILAAMGRTTGQNNIVLGEEFQTDATERDYQERDLISFLAAAGKLGNKAYAFMSENSKNNEIEQKYCLDPYQLFENEIKLLKSDTIEDKSLKKVVDVVKYIAVENGEKNILIPYIGLQLSRRKYIHKIYASGVLKKIKYMCMLYDGAKHYAIPL